MERPGTSLVGSGGQQGLFLDGRGSKDRNINKNKRGTRNVSCSRNKEENEFQKVDSGSMCPVLPRSIEHVREILGQEPDFGGAWQ